MAYIAVMALRHLKLLRMTVLTPSKFLKMQCELELRRRIPTLTHLVDVQDCEDQQALDLTAPLIIIDESADVVEFDRLVVD
jgi:hypothetical protein